MGSGNNILYENVDTDDWNEGSDAIVLYVGHVCPTHIGLTFAVSNAGFIGIALREQCVTVNA